MEEQIIMDHSKLILNYAEDLNDIEDLNEV